MTPSDSPTKWTELLHDFGPMVFSAGVVVYTWFKTKVVRNSDDLRAQDEVKNLRRTVDEHTTLINDHSNFIKAQTQIASDVRSTRDCVIGIASHLKLEGPR